MSMSISTSWRVRYTHDNLYIYKGRQIFIICMISPVFRYLHQMLFKIIDITVKLFHRWTKKKKNNNCLTTTITIKEHIHVLVKDKKTNVYPCKRHLFLYKVGFLKVFMMIKLMEYMWTRFRRCSHQLSTNHSLITLLLLILSVFRWHKS